MDQNVVDQDTPGTSPGTVTWQQVVDTISDLLPRVLRREVAASSPDTRLMEDLGMSSSSSLELMLELEENLEIQINVEDIDRDDFNTIGTLARFVVGHLLPAG